MCSRLISITIQVEDCSKWICVCEYAIYRDLFELRWSSRLLSRPRFLSLWRLLLLLFLSRLPSRLWLCRSRLLPFAGLLEKRGNPFNLCALQVPEKWPMCANDFESYWNKSKWRALVRVCMVCAGKGSGVRLKLIAIGRKCKRTSVKSQAFCVWFWAYITWFDYEPILRLLAVL